MTFFDKIQELRHKILAYESQSVSEAVTKMAFVHPMLMALGYNVHNPKEVIAEYTADVGLMKGEKVDYCIFRDQAPVLIIECKAMGTALGKRHRNQLHRYFHTTHTRFAVLTNGNAYQFFSDFDKANIMDAEPFWEFELKRMKEDDIALLSHFTQKHFDEKQIIAGFKSLSDLRKIRSTLVKELQEPSEEFVYHVLKAIGTGRVTRKMVMAYTPLVKIGIQEAVELAFGEAHPDKGRTNVVSALLPTSDSLKKPASKRPTTGTAKAPAGIITTEEELEGFRMIKSMLGKYVKGDRIQYKDVKSYFNVLLDGNVRTPICRLYFNSSTKYVSFKELNGKWIKHKLEQLEDLSQFSSFFLLALRRHLIAEELMFSLGSTRKNYPSKNVHAMPSSLVFSMV